MAKTEEIPRHRWIEFLDQLTRQHQGDPVTMEVLDLDAGAQIQAQDQPLQGISADVRAAGEHDVSIMVGRGPEPPLTHIVPEARHVRIERGEGGDKSLEIEAGDGSRTLVHFRLLRAA